VKTKQQTDIGQVWQQFHETRDDLSRNLLIEQYSPLVKYAARQLHSSLPDSVELDDLISAGNLGLMDAISNYDPTKGVKFETYCSPRIRGSILDELRSTDWLPRLVRFRAKQLAKARQLLEGRLGRKPNDKEIAAELDMDMKEFKRLRRGAKLVSLLSLDTSYSQEDGEQGIREIDVVKDSKSVDPVIEAEKRDQKELLTRSLTLAEKLILTLYYYEGMTMKEIGLTVGLSESRVSQMHSSIIPRLKALLYNRKKEFRD
jgi:RNA polymerase sigma factor for flagellar operon FliA